MEGGKEKIAKKLSTKKSLGKRKKCKTEKNGKEKENKKLN